MQRWTVQPVRVALCVLQFNGRALQELSVGWRLSVWLFDQWRVVVLHKRLPPTLLGVLVLGWVLPLLCPDQYHLRPVLQLSAIASRGRVMADTAVLAFTIYAAALGIAGGTGP